MPIRSQIPAAGDQFDGTTGKGLFSFKSLDRIPRTSRVHVNILAYHAPAAEPESGVGTLITFRLVRRAPGPHGSLRIMLGEFDPSANLNADGSSDVKLCPFTVPRDPAPYDATETNGDHWDVVVTGAGKDVEAALMLDYWIEHHEDTSPEDSKD